MGVGAQRAAPLQIVVTSYNPKLGFDAIALGYCIESIETLLAVQQHTSVEIDNPLLVFLARDGEIIAVPRALDDP